MPTQYMTLAEIAKAAGITVDSARTYHKRATAHRTAGHPRPGDLPEPDITIGQTPGWETSTIMRWLETRPRAGRK